ncbi:MFS general substrate transporter [Diplocarpon rosae]|nr:MFS general substrate transporter [Diplocarpon rosae]
MPLRGHSLAVAQLALIVAPSFILFGYNQAGVGGLLSLPDWTKTFPEIDTTNTTGAKKSSNATLQGLIVGTFVLGALVGSLACMKIGDILGRRKTIFLAATLTLVGEALCTSSFGLAQFTAGRTIIGLGIGILSATVPVWQAECSSAANRGKHVVLDGLFMTLGFSLVAWINLGASQIKSGTNIQASWRMPLGIPIAFSLLLMGAIFTMPESPRWLILINHVEDARTILANLKDLSENDPIITAEIEGIQSSLEETTAKKASMTDMFTMGPEKLFYRFSLCIMLQFYQQMSGSNLISVYAPVIFQQNLGLDGQTSRILSGGTLTWKFLSSFVAFFTIDRYGRRALFMFSGTGTGACMLALAVATWFPKTNQAAGIASVFFVFLFNFFVPIGFLGANFLYCAEVAPVKLRVSMAAISTANHWLWNFVVIMATPVAITNLGSYYFIIFCVISFCIPVTVYFFYPETMGQSLEQIDAVFRDNKTPMAIVRASKLMAKGGVAALDEERKHGNRFDDANSGNEKESIVAGRYVSE